MMSVTKTDQSQDVVDTNMESPQKLSYEYSSPDYQYLYDSPMREPILCEPRSPSPTFSSRSNSPPISLNTPSPLSGPIPMSPIRSPLSPYTSPLFSPTMNVSFSSSDSFQSPPLSPSPRSLTPTLSSPIHLPHRSGSPQLNMLNILRVPSPFRPCSPPSAYRSPSPRPLFSVCEHDSKSLAGMFSIQSPLSPSTFPSSTLSSSKPTHHSRRSNSPSTSCTLNVANSPSRLLPPESFDEPCHSPLTSPYQSPYSLRSPTTIQSPVVQPDSQIDIKHSPAHSANQPTCSIDRNNSTASESPPVGKPKPFYSFSPTFHLSKSKLPQHISTFHLSSNDAACSSSEVSSSSEVANHSLNQVGTNVKVEEVVDVEQNQPCIVDLTCEDDDDVEIVSSDQPVVFLGTEPAVGRRFKKHRLHHAGLQSSCSSSTEPIVICDNIQDDAGNTPATAINVDSPVTTLPLSHASNVPIDLVGVSPLQTSRVNINPQVFGDLLNQSIIPLENDGQEMRRSCMCVLNGSSSRQAAVCGIHGSSGYRFNDRVLQLDRSRSPIHNNPRSALDDPIPPDVLEDIRALYEKSQRCHRPFSILKSKLLSGRDVDLRHLSGASNVQLQAPYMHNHHFQAPQASASSSAEDSGGLSCPICFESFQEIKKEGKSLSSTVCGHIFCTNCLEAAFKQVKQCPTCRKRLNKKQYHPLYI